MSDSRIAPVVRSIVQVVAPEHAVEVGPGLEANDSTAIGAAHRIRLP